MRDDACGGGSSRDRLRVCQLARPSYVVLSCVSARPRSSLMTRCREPHARQNLLNVYMQCTLYTIDSSSCASCSAGRIMLCIGTPRLMPFPPAMSSAMRDESCAATAASAMSGIGDLGNMKVCVEGSRLHPRWCQW